MTVTEGERVGEQQKADRGEVWSYVCPSCGAAIPHGVSNTICAPSGTMVDPSSFPLPPEGDHIDPLDEMAPWRDAAIDAFWMVDGGPE